jgi:hypothetical protein
VGVKHLRRGVVAFVSSYAFLELYKNWKIENGNSKIKIT